MGFLSNLFGGKKTEVRKTTHEHPFHIENPTIGFLNLLGKDAAEVVAADTASLSPLFQDYRVSTDLPPRCQVLFIYCDIGSTGRIVGANKTLRELIKDAGAYVAVVASENDTEAYIKAMEGRNDWNANIVLSMDRNGEKFAEFFSKLFSAMFKGTSMLIAWVELVPQIPGYDHPDAPGTIMAAEAGHIVFKRSG
ncbi:MAG: hypothetical protein VB050_14810 [Geobacteraceae bacterium]|nr:hypothetical protein [Geobacteraceae bacterium]